jgi:YVTN family beta-propeller protein
MSVSWSMSDLPSGAVTFLFTDIEGSTRLLKQLRAGYAEVLVEHQRLLRAAFAAHGGREIDTQGDSFFVAFGSAREAVLAAVEGQLALMSHPWPDGVHVKVRMGLHTGQAIAGEDRYTGLAVHRAARICAAGHGGQILVSQATQTLLEDEEEDLHVFLRDLGEQRLKDLDRPVRLYQVAADGLPVSFPPVRHEAEPAGAAIRAPLRRRPAVLIAAGLVLATVVAAAAFLTTRDSAGGLGEIRPNHVGAIDPETNEIVAEVTVGIRPGPVAVGAGSVWVGNLQDRNLTRIDPQQRLVAAAISLDNRTPTGLAVGAGAVWVAHGLSGELTRVEPQFGQAEQAIDVTGGRPGTAGGAVAVGAGFVWAVYGDSTLARMQPGGGGLPESTLAGSSPTAIAVGAGSLWVANSGDATVDRFNPATFAEGPIRTISVGRRPTGIAYGEGALWIANRGDDTVTRVDPSTGSTLDIRVADEPVAVAVGAGAVWVANFGAGMVSRIDPTTNEVVQMIEVGGAPAGIAVEGELVWVAAQSP